MRRAIAQRETGRRGRVDRGNELFDARTAKLAGIGRLVLGRRDGVSLLSD